MQKAQSFFQRQGARSFQRDVREVAGALWNAGTAAMTELAHRQAEASQYVLEEHTFEVVKATGLRRIRYDEVKRIHVAGDRATLVLERGSLIIKPFAHVTSGRLKVPIGWSRNGVEVPYELLIEELAARCDLELEIE